MTPSPHSSTVLILFNFRDKHSQLTLLENILLVYVEKAKYMQSVLQFFVITVAAYPKGKLSAKDSDQILSLPIDIYLYILATMLFPYDTFLYDMHTRKYHFCTGIKICFYEPPTFCWLRNTLTKRRPNQNGWILII